MADTVDTYLKQLEDDYDQPPRIRKFFARRPQVRTQLLRPNLGGGASVSVTLASGQGNPVGVVATTINFTVTFSEAATGFTNADVSFTGSTAGGTLAAAVTGTGPAYNVAVTGFTSTGGVSISIPAASATTAKGVPFPASNAATVTYDITRPLVTIDRAAGQANPALFSPILYTVVFNEPVTGFTSGDISFSGSTVTGTLAAAISGGPSTYTVSVTGMTGTTGNVQASVLSNSTSDAAGNLNQGSTSPIGNIVGWAPDVTAPTVTINKGAGQADPSTGGSSIIFDVVFSEVVTGFIPADISFTGSTTGGTLAAAISGTGPTYTVTVTGMAAPDGNVVASIPAASVVDLSGNANTASTSTDNIVAWTAPVGGVSVQTYFFITGQY